MASSQIGIPVFSIVGWRHIKDIQTHGDGTSRGIKELKSVKHLNPGQTGSPEVNCECATPQNFPSLGNSPLRYLRLRPDCEGVLHRLRFRTDQVFPSQRIWFELTVACDGRLASAK